MIIPVSSPYGSFDLRLQYIDIEERGKRHVYYRANVYHHYEPLKGAIIPHIVVNRIPIKDTTTYYKDVIGDKQYWHYEPWDGVERAEGWLEKAPKGASVKWREWMMEKLLELTNDPNILADLDIEHRENELDSKQRELRSLIASIAETQKKIEQLTVEVETETAQIIAARAKRTAKTQTADNTPPPQLAFDWMKGKV